MKNKAKFKKIDFGVIKKFSEEHCLFVILNGSLWKASTDVDYKELTGGIHSSQSRLKEMEMSFTITTSPPSAIYLLFNNLFTEFFLNFYYIHVLLNPSNS